MQTYTLKPRGCYRTCDINVYCEEDTSIMKLFTDYEYDYVEMGLTVPNQDLADLPTLQSPTKTGGCAR